MSLELWKNSSKHNKEAFKITSLCVRSNITVWIGCRFFSILLVARVNLSNSHYWMVVSHLWPGEWLKLSECEKHCVRHLLKTPSVVPWTVLPVTCNIDSTIKDSPIGLDTDPVLSITTPFQSMQHNSYTVQILVQLFSWSLGGQ